MYFTSFLAGVTNREIFIVIFYRAGSVPGLPMHMTLEYSAFDARWADMIHACIILCTCVCIISLYCLHYTHPLQLPVSGLIYLSFLIRLNFTRRMCGIYMGNYTVYVWLYDIVCMLFLIPGNSSFSYNYGANHNVVSVGIPMAWSSGWGIQ